MARKVFPIHLRLNHVKNYFQSWYSDLFYSQTWFKDLKLRRFASTLMKRGSVYKLARAKSKRTHYSQKSHWTLGNLWSRFSFFRVGTHTISHILPKDGPQAFYSPFGAKRIYKRYKKNTKKLNF